MSKSRGPNRLGLYIFVMFLLIDHCSMQKDLDHILEILEPTAEAEARDADD